MAQGKPDLDDAVGAAKAVHGHVRDKIRAGRAVNDAPETVANLGRQEVSSVNPGAGQVAGGEAAANEPSMLSAMGLNGTGMAVMLAPAAPAIVSGAAKVTSKGLRELGANKAASVVENAGDKSGRFFDSSVAKIVGEKRAEKVVKAAEKVTAPVAGGINRVAKFVGVGSAGEKYSGWRAEGGIAKLDKMLATHGELHAHNIPDAFKPEVNAVLEHARGLRAGTVTPEAFAKVKEELANKLATQEAAHALDRKALGHVSKIADVTERVVGHQASAKAFRAGNVAGFISDMPKGFMKSKVVPGGIGAFFLITSLAAIAGTVKGAVQNLASLKDLASDLTGKKQSTLSVLLGDMPPLVKEARSKLTANLFLTGGSEVFGAGLSAAAMSRGNISWLSFMAPAAVGMGSSYFIGEGVAPYYKVLKDAHKAGQQIPVEAYTDLIGQCSPELMKRGAVGQAFAEKLAEKYAKENASPAVILKEAGNGTLMKRVEVLIAENEAKRPAAGVVQGRSHVAALQGKAAGKENPVLGVHTKKLAENTAIGNSPVLGGA